jgi:beta-galactosidase
VKASRWSRRDLLKLTAATALVGSDAVPPGSAFANGGVQAAPSPDYGLRDRALLDFGWRFHFGNANDPAKDFGFGQGKSGDFEKTGDFMLPSQLVYDDSNWIDVDLPHDWAIGLPFTDDHSLLTNGAYPLGRQYPDTSIGWYRRVIDISAAEEGKRITIEFDGVYRDCIIAFNGFYVGRHSGGYDSFSIDVTDFVTFGGSNVILVRVDATLSDGWFYAGAGIYRHVWLTTMQPVHVRRWGTFVRAEIQAGSALLSVRTEIDNQLGSPQSVRVISTIIEPSGTVVATITTEKMAIQAGGELTCEQQVTVQKPALWSLEDRHLYTLVTEVQAGGARTDRYETPFGIRTMQFFADKGFFLNGKSVKIKGTANHQDHAGLGSALPDAAHRFRIGKLLDMGCNAYRTAHNPTAPEFLDACDELGMLVLAETRFMSSNVEGLAQLANMIRRDRNHPSIFMWSMGNEERMASTELGRRILSAMKNAAMDADGSRPVTIAPQPLGIGLGEGGLQVSDVMGYNYADPQVQSFHEAHPSIPIMGTENVSAVGTRGVYETNVTKGYISSYDSYTTTGRASAQGWWQFVEQRPWLAGGFVWAGFDYRGEPAPFPWPNISAQYGVLDTCGFPKDTFYYYQASWRVQPVLHVLPHWNWTGLEGQQIAVWVYSNLDTVELVLNGRSLGSKPVIKNSHLSWIVEFEPGTLEARGFRNGRQVMIARRITAGEPAKLALRTDRSTIDASGEDLTFCEIEIQDANGTVVPNANNLVTFKVTGSGKLRGVGNGNPTSHESDVGVSRSAFSGLCMAIIQSGKVPGAIHVQATSPGLRSVAVIIAANPVVLRPQVPVWQRLVPLGEGVTGLWRPVHQTQAAEGPAALQLDGGGGAWAFTLRQIGSALTGTVEAPAPMFGASAGGSIREGEVNGTAVSFTAGVTHYKGAVRGDTIELEVNATPFDPFVAPAPPIGRQPVIGPPPDGSDFVLAAFSGARRAPTLTLQRASR